MKAADKFPNPALMAILKQRGFRVNWNELTRSQPTPFGRRHFYLILLSVGNSKIHFDDHVFHLDGVYLFFANSRVPYATEILSDTHKGYSCIFTEEFIKPMERLESLKQSPLFKTSGTSAFKLDPQQQARLTGIFDTMIASDSTDYVYKDDLMRNYIPLQGFLIKPIVES